MFSHGKKHGLRGGGRSDHGRGGFGLGMGPRGGHRGGGHRGGGGRRGRILTGGELRLLLLHLIQQDARHGYELIRAIETLSGGGYVPSPGVIYPALSLLEDQGLIRPDADTGGRKAYALTPEGAADVSTNGAAIATIIERITAAATADSSGLPPVRRAMENLKSVLRNRSTVGGTEDLPHDIAAIIDDAAQRIERLA